MLLALVAATDSVDFPAEQVQLQLGHGVLPSSFESSLIRRGLVPVDAYSLVRPHCFERVANLVEKLLEHKANRQRLDAEWKRQIELDALVLTEPRAAALSLEMSVLVAALG